MSQEANFDINLSQGSSIDENEMAEMEKSSRPKSTERATKSGVKKIYGVDGTTWGGLRPPYSEPVGW